MDIVVDLKTLLMCGGVFILLVTFLFWLFVRTVLKP